MTFPYVISVFLYFLSIEHTLFLTFLSNLERGFLATLFNCRSSCTGNNLS